MNSANVGKSDARRGDQMVNDSQVGLAGDGQVVFHQQVVILVHRTSQAILDWSSGGVCGAGRYSVEHLFKDSTRHGFNIGTQKLASCVFAEGPPLALIGYSQSAVFMFIFQNLLPKTLKPAAFVG